MRTYEEISNILAQDDYIFDKLKNKRIVLNKSVLDNNDVYDFERESGSKVFFNIPYLDEKLENNQKINEFLIALGFSRIENNMNRW